MHLLFLFLLKGFFPLTLSFVLTELLQFLSLGLFVSNLIIFGLSYKLENYIFEIDFVTVFLDIAPDNHNSILKLHSKLSSILFSLIIMELGTATLQSHKMLLPSRITNNVINCRLSPIPTNKLGFMLI